MTSEVVIANSGAVALAADSAVTIGNQKIYNSALKLFSLSKIAPVGVMVFGNAGLMSVPWETIIKQYRAHLGDDCFPEIKDFALDFLKFIGNSDYFPESLQQQWIAGNIAGYFGNYVLSDIKKAVKNSVDEKGDIDTATTKRLVADTIARHHEELRTKEHIDGMNAKFENSLKTKYKALIDTLIDQVFQKLPITIKLRSQLHNIAVFLHTRDFFSTGISGLVIAGFGEKEIYPSVCTFKVEGVVSGKIKCKRLKDKCLNITAGNECGIVAFAQEDMVDAFMSGMNPDIHSFVDNYLKRLLVRLPELIPDDILKGTKAKKAAALKAYRKDIDALFTSFGKDLSEHMYDRHISPVLSMVQVLPKDELAAMAESLVNLTAFKRRMTDALETVGGPIDVAVISKGDGLVWVKRKHYFPPELNQHFFSNYFRGVEK